jgi:hypothetical protein
MTSTRCAAIRTFSAALLVFAAPALGQVPEKAQGAQNAQNSVIRFLDAIPARDGGLAYSVVPGSDLVLPFAVDKGGNLELYLSPLRGEHGDTASMEFSIDGVTLTAAKDRRFAFSAADGAIFQLRLKAPTLSQPGKYSGTLTVLRDGKRSQTDRLDLTRALAPRAAKLAVDWKSPTVYERTLSAASIWTCIKNILGFVQPDAFNLQVRNTSDWPAEGLFLRVLEVTAPPGNNFDPERHLKLTLNGAPAEGLWRTPPVGSSGRSLAPNQQLAIGGQSRDLAPGEYTVKIGLGAANTTIDNENPIILKVFVKHGVALPLLVLLLAIVISWTATKGLEAQRRRGTQLAKIKELKKGAWRQERDSMPAVAARAFLRQAEDRNERWWDTLFGQDTTTAHVARAELLFKILGRVGELRDRIARSGWTTMTMHRANKRLTDILAPINPEVIDANAATRIEGQLAELERWFDPKERDTLYMGTLKNDLRTLLDRAKPEAFDLNNKQRIDNLRAEIATGSAPGAQQADIEAMERAYGILKILWERRSADDSAPDPLFDMMNNNPKISLEDFFYKADTIAWAALRPADFEFENGDMQEVEQYELREFKIRPAKPKLGENFLFKHKLTYIWALQLVDGSRDSKTVTEQRTNEPRVVQYAPKLGQYRMKVTLENEGERAKVSPSLVFTVKKSSDYGPQSILRFTDVAALGIATLFALITGLATYYFGKPAFGSITDYVSLFVWGAGVDQTKNFLQQLGKTSGTG